MINGLKPYPKYKDSGVPWLGQVPAHWEVMPHRALFEEVKEQNHPEEPMLSVTINRGVVKQIELLTDSSKKDSSRLDKSAYKLVCPGDIAYNKMRAWQGAIGVSDFRGIVSPAYVVQRFRGTDNHRYFHYLFRTAAFIKEAERWSYGITSDMWSLRPEHFKLIYSPHPPLPEQTAIVRFLDWAERRLLRAIRVRQKRITLLEEYKQALIHQVVTGQIDVRTGQPYPAYKESGIEWLGQMPTHWEVRRLRQVATMLVSNVDKHNKDNEIPIRLCNYVDVYKKDRITENIRFMSASATKDEVERFRLQKEDVAITKDSETRDDIGVPGLIECSAPDLVYGYHLAILHPHKEVLKGPYLFRAIQSQGVAIQFHVGANGVTRFGLSHNAIKTILVTLPPVPEQTAIVRFLDNETEKVDTAIATDRRAIELLKEFRTRLIADVVTGKLDVHEVAARLPEEPEPKDEEDTAVAAEPSPSEDGLEAVAEELSDD